MPADRADTRRATLCCSWGWVPRHSEAMWWAARYPNPAPSPFQLIPHPQVYRQLRQPPPTLHSLKKEGYKESMSVHPEQEAESKASHSGPPPTSVEVPLVLPSHVPYLLIGAGTASHACANAIQQRDASAKVHAMDNAHTPNSSPISPLHSPFPPL